MLLSQMCFSAMCCRFNRVLLTPRINKPKLFVNVYSQKFGFASAPGTVRGIVEGDRSPTEDKSCWDDRDKPPPPLGGEGDERISNEVPEVAAAGMDPKLDNLERRFAAAPDKTPAIVRPNGLWLPPIDEDIFSGKKSIFSKKNIFLIELEEKLQDSKKSISFGRYVLQRNGIIDSKNKNKKICLLSNAPRRVSKVKQFLEEMLITQDCYDFLITSGEVWSIEGIGGELLIVISAPTVV